MPATLLLSPSILRLFRVRRASRAAVQSKPQLFSLGLVSFRLRPFQSISRDDNSSEGYCLHFFRGATTWHMARDIIAMETGNLWMVDRETETDTKSTNRKFLSVFRTVTSFGRLSAIAFGMISCARTYGSRFSERAEMHTKRDYLGEKLIPPNMHEHPSARCTTRRVYIITCEPGEREEKTTKTNYV